MIRKIRSAAFAAAIAAALLALLFVTGCGGGGKKTNEVSSPWNGTISGIATEPQDNENNIALDSWIHVYWPDEDFPPPPRFTVRLEKESGTSWGAVRTILKSSYSDAEGGSWWFEPSSKFSPNAWYRIVVRDDDGRTYTATFLTANIQGSVGITAQSVTSSLKKYRPTGAENAAPSGEAGEDEHIITTTTK